MHHPRILIIEHDETIRSRLKAILTEMNYAVLEAGNLEEALKVIIASNGQAPVHGLLLDLHMPDSSVMETVNFLRGHLPGVPIAGLWESPDFALSSVLSGFGVGKFLYKSVTAELLGKTLENMLAASNPAPPQ